MADSVATPGTGVSGLGASGGTSTAGLAPWIAPYITNYLGRAQALADMPYQVYQGPQTAGMAPLQQAAFQGIGNLAVPQAMLQSTDFLSQIAQNLGNFQYQPQGVSFTGGPIPSRFNMPLTAAPSQQLQQGNIGQPIGAGEYVPWGGFRQRVEAVPVAPVAPPPVTPVPVAPSPVAPSPVAPSPVAPVTPSPVVPPANNYYGVSKPAYTGDSRQDQITQQQFQKDVATKVVGAPAVAAVSNPNTRSDKADQVLGIYNQLGRTGALQPSAAEVAFWASQNKPIEQIRQDLLNSAATFKEDPIYGHIGQIADRLLKEGKVDQVRLDLPDSGVALYARGGSVGYADGGTVSSGMTDMNQGIGSLGYNTPAATGSANILGNVNAATPMASQPVSGIAQQYMNPYLNASLQPQLEEQRRQSQINLQPSLAKLTQAGGFGGGRQAIMESEALRNLGTQQAATLGQGYNTAFNQAQQQFNEEQKRAIQEAQFGSELGLRAAQQQAQAAQAMGQLGLSQNQAQLDNLRMALLGGQTQRDIEQQGITADYNEFLKQVQYPYTQNQYMRDMISGLPVGSVTNTPTQLSGVASLIAAVGGLDKLLGATGQKDLNSLLGNLFGGTLGNS